MSIYFFLFWICYNNLPEVFKVKTFSLLDVAIMALRFGKNTSFQNREKFDYGFFTNDIIYMYLPFTYNNLIILSLLKVVS